GDDLQMPADEQTRHFEGGRATIEQNGVAIAQPSSGGASDLALLVELPGGAFLQGGQAGFLAADHGPAVGAPPPPLLVEVLQVAPDGRFRHLDGLRQLVQGREALPADQIEQTLTAFGDEQWSFLTDIATILKELEAFR